jgi:predicted nucleic acid-binding protein
VSVLVDTDVLIDHARAHPAAREVIERTERREELLFGSLVTKAEFLAGLRGEVPHVVELLDSLEWMPVTDEIAERAGGLAREYPRPGARFAIADYLIAATAQLLDAKLLTRNVRHFPMFPGLQAPYGL